MTKYLKKYIEYIQKRLDECIGKEQLEEILSEHRDKIAFMQHERLVHFLVTMMFALILVMLVIGLLLTENLTLSILTVIIFVLLLFYIKHYYFLENTVQNMYRIYDKIILKRKQLDDKDGK